MDIHGLTHLENILYREDELKERTRLVFKWIYEKELTQEQFDILISYCNEERIKQDKVRRYELGNGIKSIVSDSVSSTDVINFFDDNLKTFRQWVKDAKTKNQQELHIRYCDATSFLKQTPFWL